ncbi:MAG: sensory box protein [Zetaproteobacteria bacterium CG2_30_46_52]|nr:MAG: sensory box protein [Zetaproteobacteria bacterium CG2_30_46_52]
MSDSPVTSEENKEDNTLDFTERRMQALAQENTQLRAYVATMMQRLHTNDELFGRLFQLEAAVLAAGDPEDMCFTLLRELRSQFSLDLVRFWLCRDSIIGTSPMNALSSHDLVWIEAGEIEHVGLAKRDVYLIQVEKDGFPWLEETDKSLGSLALLRLGSAENPFGILGLGAADAARFSPEQGTDFLQHLAQVIGLSLEHAVSRERLARLAITDALTGSHNRRFLQPYSHQPLSRWFGKDVSVAALYFDLDDFKGINDRLGHQAGDEALNQLCDAIRRHVRTQDPLIRMGGDEFSLLLSGCNTDKAQEIATNILNDVNGLVCNNEQIRISVGLACSAPTEDITLNTLIAKADKGMYIAKALGGNRIEIAAKD